MGACPRSRALIARRGVPAAYAEAGALEEAGQKTVTFKHDLAANEQHRGSCARDIGYGVEEVRFVP